MTKTLRLRIVTPDAVIHDGEVHSVQFAGLDGSYGILANHAPLVTATLPGALRFKTADGRLEELVVTDGFAEMVDNVLSIVCEAGERGSEIDVARAREAEKRARDLLANRAALASEDVIRAEESLRRALIRQVVGQRAGQSLDR